MIVGIALSGCASTGASVSSPTYLASAEKDDEPKTIADPNEKFNRSVFDSNQDFNHSVLYPTAKAYNENVPEEVRDRIDAFTTNLNEPMVFANNVLQLRPAAAATTLGRFALNSTLGLGGLFDPATRAGFDRNNEDFGQTLGKWGVRPGAYVVVPFLGPYTLRDGFGSLADDFAEPRHYLEDDSTRWELWAAGQLDRRSGLTEAEAILDRSGDPYAFVRSAYLQRRQYLVTDGAEPADEEPLEDPELMEDEDAAGDAPSPPQ